MSTVMQAKAYYNEIDPYAAAWLRNLIRDGLIACGDVDTRSIEDVQPNDLKGYTQCHFFAGIGVWSLALRNAGWRDDEPVWTGSCPCQPFSAAGKQKGVADPRHLWPAWFRLIRECRPGVIFGEQVRAAIRHGWLDLVSSDLEGIDYRVGAAVMGAHSVGAPHIRDRCYFVADTDSERRGWEHSLLLRVPQGRVTKDRVEVAGRGETGAVADAECNTGIPWRTAIKPAEGIGAASAGTSTESGRRRMSSELGLADDEGPQGRGLHGATGGGDGAGKRAARPAIAVGSLMAYDEAGRRGEVDQIARGRDEGNETQGGERSVGGDRAAGGFWSACDWLPCIDGKARPVEPSAFPLVNGPTARVGRLRAYGNALVAPCAEAFIAAYMNE